jgi:predicted DNA-binding transcriptional regulator AlpA
MSQAARKTELPRYVGYAEIAEATGIERHTIQRLMKSGKFPKPDALPTKENRWRLAVVSDWLEQRNAEQIAALSDSAVTDPAKLKPEQVVDALRTLSARFAAINGIDLAPDDILGFTYKLTDEQRAALTRQAGEASSSFCEAFGRLDPIRALLVVGGLMPVLRPMVDSFLEKMVGVRPGESHEELRDLAVDILCQSKEGEFVGPPASNSR